MDLALYYPFIIPSQNWMKQSLLFFDGIASIVPEDFDYRPLSPSLTNYDNLADLEWLQAEGLWYPTYVHDISSDLFERELQLEIATLSHHPELRDEAGRAPLLSTILSDKFADFVEDWLLHARIAQRSGGNLAVPDYALLAIMSVAAKWAAYDGRHGRLFN